ncbi:MAG TPA: hypothetical protein VMV31_07945 [Terriglobales bacterium]|nr:hypothetical protein [Terriglobales bacterium]
MVWRGVAGWVFLGAAVAAAPAAAQAAPARARVLVAAPGNLTEVQKTFLQRCPEVVVTERAEQAGFVFQLERQPNEGLLHRRDKWALLVAVSGDVIAAGSDRSVGNAVKDACAALRRRGAGAPAGKGL